MSISDEILKAIEIALSKTDNVNYDKTYIGTIKEILSSKKYSVEYDGATRTITTRNELGLSPGDAVHVLCPRNNIAKQMLLEDLSTTGGGSGGGTTAVQSNWAETDPSSDAYIKNKPKIPSTASDVGAYSKTEVDTIIANLDINPDDIDLSDYVTKTELEDYSTTTEMNNAITTALEDYQSDVYFRVNSDRSVTMIFKNE